MLAKCKHIKLHLSVIFQRINVVSKLKLAIYSTCRLHSIKVIGIGISATKWLDDRIIKHNIMWLHCSATQILAFLVSIVKMSPMPLLNEDGMWFFTICDFCWLPVDFACRKSAKKVTNGNHVTVELCDIIILNRMLSTWIVIT